MSEQIAHLTTANFKDAVASTTPTLVDFWAPWCGPCKAIGPILDELSKEFGPKLNIAKVNVDDEDTLAAQYNIRAIPAMFLFKGGQVVTSFVGLMPKADLQAKLAAHV